MGVALLAPKLNEGVGRAGELPNEGAGAGVLAFGLPPNVNGLFSWVLGAGLPKLKLGAGVGVAFPPNWKPVVAGWGGVGLEKLKPELAG